MSKSIYRWQDEIKPIEFMSKSSKLINMNTVRRDPRFSNKKGYVATTFKKNTYLYNVGEIPYTYDKEFTVCFWAKFEKLKDIDEVHPNCIHIIFNDGTSIGATLPKTIGTDNKELVQTDWNWYKIQRDTNNTVTIYVNNEQIATGTSTAVFNLNDKSYIYLGNDSKTLTGYDITVDDVLIFGGVNEYLKDIPTDYLELSKFYKMVYIKVADNSVWAMKSIQEEQDGTSTSGGRAVINLCTGHGIVKNYKREYYGINQDHIYDYDGYGDDFYIDSDRLAYGTGPLREFSFELMLGDEVVNEDKFPTSIILNSLKIKMLYPRYFNIFLGSTKLNETPLEIKKFFYLIYKYNKLCGYYNNSENNFEKSKATEIFSINTSLDISDIKFINPNRQCLKLLRLSDRANDLYYAK